VYSTDIRHKTSKHIRYIIWLKISLYLYKRSLYFEEHTIT